MMSRSSVLHGLACAALLAATSAAAQPTLLDAAENDTVQVAPFQYAADKAFRAPLTLRRIDVYAEDAQIRVAGPNGLEPLPRASLNFFVTDIASEPQRAYFAVDPDNGTFEGAVFDAEGTFILSGHVSGNRLQIEQHHRSDDLDAHFQCANDHHASLNVFDEHVGKQAKTELDDRPANLLAATHTARLAIDTDNEFMNLKFGNNLTNANNYIAALVAGMNVFYERDLSVRLLIGDVILRPSTTPDPYASTSATDTFTQLNEFGEHWRTNQSALTRAFALQLSGKSTNAFSASGIAWIIDSGNYCSAKGSVMSNGTFGHYSTTRVFRFPNASAANDVSIVGHELGHNFGAQHSHCSSAASGGLATGGQATIDRCFNAESVSGGTCHTGAVSCPIDNSVSGRGSLMSYCNFSTPSGAGCGAVLQEFHPAHQSFLGGRISTNIGNSCLVAINSAVGPQISASSPASGSTTALGGGAVGSQVNRAITFTVSGGSGAGTTQLSCSGSGALQIISGTPQTIAVSGSVAPVNVRFTLTTSAQSGSVTCTATRQGGGSTNFNYAFTAPAGTAPSPFRIFCNGFESANCP